MGSNLFSNSCCCCDKQEPSVDRQMLTFCHYNPAFATTRGDSDSDEEEKKPRAFLDRYNAEKMKFTEEMRVRNEKFQKEMENTRRNREMLEKENDIRKHGDVSRRIKIEHILDKNEVVLFVLSWENERNQRATDILKNKKISYGTIFVDDNTEVRLGIKEYTRCETFPQLFVNGNLVDVYTYNFQQKM